MSMGIVTVSDRAVMQLASYITKQHDGVSRLVDKKSSDGIARTIKGEWDTKGVYLIKKKSGLMLEICVMCRFGVNTVSLCEDIEKEIDSGLCEMGFNVKSINVNIVGVE